MINQIKQIISRTYELLIENNIEIIDDNPDIDEEKIFYISLEADNIILKNSLREIEQIIKNDIQS